jgi:branched-chain amino acid aminotransferase
MIWLNGTLHENAGDLVGVDAHALHYGSAVFEGIRAYETPEGTAIFRLQDHLDRLRSSAAAYRMEIPHSDAELREAIWQLIDQSGMRSAYIRPIAFRGSAQLGIYPLGCPVETAVMVLPWGAYLGEEALTGGVRACMSPYRRFSNDMFPSAAKASGQYLNSILAKLDSSDRGFEEAILLNETGHVCEGTGENVFVVTQTGDVLTPALDQSILPGITRGTVIEMLVHMGYCHDMLVPERVVIDGKRCVLEGAVDPRELREAVEVFLTGTAAEITPVRSLDPATSGASETSQVTDYGGRGDLTRQLQELFFATVRGEDTAFSHLLEYR